MHCLPSVCWLADPSRSSKRPRLFWAFVLTFATLIYASQPASAQFVQQGPKLVGTGATGVADQGISVALSADGNTAIIGGYEDDSGIGATWVFTRNAPVWTQQGSKLIGVGATGAQQGRSVALSADGNTMIVGGYFDDSGVGAARVFIRNGGVWSQQGDKLIGAGAVGGASQGWSVALSADGNTAIVGGSSDNGGAGATWLFTRNGTTWTQQGNKLVGTGATGGAGQGEGVALSADGNTAIVGGPTDNANLGAMWIFTRAGTVWAQQGNKLVGTNAVATSGQVYQGQSVALSADGTTAIVGGPFDNANLGAAWVFARPGTSLTVTHDFNGDGKSDILFRNTSSGAAAVWLMNGSAVTSSATIATVPSA